jgi:hypothetical protein
VRDGYWWRSDNKHKRGVNLQVYSWDLSFGEGWCEVAGDSAVFHRLELDSCILVHKNRPVN